MRLPNIYQVIFFISVDNIPQILGSLKKVKQRGGGSAA